MEIPSLKLLNARKAFLRVLDESLAAYEFKRFTQVPVEEQRLIQQRVDRLLYVPSLPYGGDLERHMVKRFERLAAQRDWEGHKRAFMMARAFRTVLPEDPRNPGCYYIRRPLTAKSNKTDHEWTLALIESARISKQWDKKWFAEQLLLGVPKAVSNFRMECRFLLRNSQGVVTRLVQLKNTAGEVSRGPHPGGCEILDAQAFCGAERFSEWGLGKGNFVWDAGVTELRMLQTDVAIETAWRVVNQVDSCGWFPTDGGPEGIVLPGMWFFDDCAYANGVQLRPDDYGIYWHDGEGFYLARKGRESQFLQGRPSMKPDRSVTVVLHGLDWKIPPEDKTDINLLRAYFREICQRLTDTLGGQVGLLALGSMFAYAAAPEIFKQAGFFSGLFVHGQKGSGKTKVVSWLMALWGFSIQSGISLTERTSTAVGMLQELENNSNLPVWFDEFRDHQIDPGKVSVIRNGFDRAGQAKYSQDGKQREIRTAPVVSGESTSSDAATRSRYPHVQVSAHQRKENHLAWFTANRDNFFVFGRFLMEQRKEFVVVFFTFWEVWMKEPSLGKTDEREKMVHGIAYAAWMGMSALLQSHASEEVASFKEFMLRFARSAANDVANETNINKFFADLITATTAGAIPLACYRLDSKMGENPPGISFPSYVLYIDGASALAHLQIFLRKQGASVVLKKKDMRDQLAMEPYWVDGNYTKHFPGNSTIRPWGIKIDLHPLGARRITEAEHADFRKNPDQGDPRKGELFGIIDMILRAQEKEDQKS
jgi:hypothetical protein